MMSKKKEEGQHDNDLGLKQKSKTNSIQTSHVLTNHTTIWTCTSLTSPIGTRGGAVSLI